MIMFPIFIERWQIFNHRGKAWSVFDFVFIFTKGFEVIHYYVGSIVRVYTYWRYYLLKFKIGNCNKKKFEIFYIATSKKSLPNMKT